MLTIAYVSRDVKYDTVGKYRLITHLKETLVNKIINVIWSRFCGSLQSTENMVRADDVITNIKKYALNK